MVYIWIQFIKCKKNYSFIIIPSFCAKKCLHVLSLYLFTNFVVQLYKSCNLLFLVLSCVIKALIVEEGIGQKPQHVLNHDQQNNKESGSNFSPFVERYLL